MTGQRRALFGYDPNGGQAGHSGKNPEEPTLTVSEINSRVRQRLERDFSQVVVSGELSNVVVAASGHLYANLKDGKSQISMVMWRGQRTRLNFDCQDGVAVVVKGRLSLYEPRGSFQLITSSMSAEGTGNLEAQFRALKARYDEMGWFDPDLKKALPFLPKTIGVATSSAGAAIHDILQTILARFPKAHVVLIPVRVQGQGASLEIAAAIDQFCEEEICDVMIVGRGGGSIEDLWAFNEPPVVEAIHRATIPVISAVGHETDYTLSDLVADYRALTPTAAAEAVVPDLLELEASLLDASVSLRRVVNRKLSAARSELNSLARSWALREPLNYLRRVEQRLDEAGRILNRTLKDRLSQAGDRLQRIGNDPGRVGLLRSLIEAQDSLQLNRERLDQRIKESMRQAEQDLVKHGRLLNGLSPLAVLDRGYSLSRKADGTIVRDSEEVEVGEVITTRFAHGEIASKVSNIVDQDEPDAQDGV